MDQRKTVHILSHTHWDREWYLDSSYTNEWLVPFFDNLFSMLEREPDYRFILDGQLSMVDDWLGELARMGRSAKEAKDRLGAQVRAGRIVLGPYYLQPDWQLVSGEALVRNLLIGRRMAEEYGGCTTTGWLLDNFGQISQTAQIHAKSGLRGLFVWRGVYMEPGEVRSEFIWRSPDGTGLPAVYLIDSYRNAMRLASAPELAERRIADEVERLAPFNGTSQVLLMNGYDQDIEPDDVMSVLRSLPERRDWRARQSTPDEYLDAVLAEDPVLPVLEGAQYVGRYISVFPGVMSARIYLKQQNELSQHTLERLVEPLSAMARLRGGEYERGFLHGLWKLLLKNHPHDSICGVSVDPVHADMERRHRLLQTLAGERLEALLAELCADIDTGAALSGAASGAPNGAPSAAALGTASGAPNGAPSAAPSGLPKGKVLVAFNTSLVPRSAIVRLSGRFVAIDGVPGLGWKAVDPGEAEALPPGAQAVWARAEAGAYGFRLGNGLVEVLLKPDGSFDLLHCSDGSRYTGLGVLEDSGDSGDLYNYSWPDRDARYTTAGEPARITLGPVSPLAAELRVERVMRVPEGLSEDGRSRSERLTELPVVEVLRLEAGSPAVKLSIKLRNTARNHVLRALFPSGLAVDHSHGGSPFDVTRRPLETGVFDESQLPPELRALIIGAREPGSNSFFLGQGFADASADGRGLAVLNRGLPEYELRREEGTIALTLFRSVGVIATEINSRLGDAGPRMLTPDGQCLRDLRFECAVLPHAGDVHAGRVAEAADAFSHPVLVAETSAHGGSLPRAGGECELVGGRALLSAFKLAERRDSVILRLYNPTEETTTVALRLGRPLRSAWSCDLLERRQRSIDPAGGGVLTFDLGAKVIETLELELEARPRSPSSPGETPAPAPALPVDEDAVEDFGAWPLPPAVSEAELHEELGRAARLSGRGDEVLFRRSALEARISAKLARCRYEEGDIRSLGRELNEARVLRRLYDYTAEYRKP